MTKVQFLEELLNEPNVAEKFGLKADGLVKLKKVFKHPFMPKPKSYVTIPDAFAVSIDAKLEDNELNTELKAAYVKLVSEFKSPRIILARSSDPEERPGKFATVPSLYLPENIEQSFNNLKSAAEQVKASGSRAVIVQPLVGNLTDFPYDYYYGENGRDKLITIKSFGGNMTSFFMNSSNFIRGETSSIVACFGLANKIARGDKDVCMIEKDAHRGQYNVINLNHQYRSQSFADFQQSTLDLITFENPTKISTLKYYERLQSGQVWCDAVIPFSEYDYKEKYLVEMGLDKDENFSYRDLQFDARDLFEPLTLIKMHFNKQIEIEGCINHEGIHLFQLREYELPQKNFKNLSSINRDKNIITEPIHGLGFNQFKGDMYVSRHPIDVPEDAIFFYEGNIYNEESLEQFKKYKQLVIPFFKANSGVMYYFTHAVGETIQTMVDLERLGIKSIAVSGLRDYDISQKLRGDRRTYKQKGEVSIFHNVTVECDGSKAQIYFNE